MPRSGMAWSYGSSIFSVLGNLHSGWTSLHSHQRCCEKAPFFSTPSPALMVCRFFDDGHSDWCEVIPHCSLICISLIISGVEDLFMCLLTITSLWINVYLNLLPIFWLGSSFYFELFECFVYFWRVIPCWLLHFQIYSSILWGFFSFCWSTVLLLTQSFLNFWLLKAYLSNNTDDILLCLASDASHYIHEIHFH